MTSCLTCELLIARDAGDRPLWDNIYRAPHWDVVHSYNTSLPGWLVLVARRHMSAVAKMTEDEAVELGLLQRHVSLALHEAIGCVKTYVVQFAEHPQHPHVHFHVIPVTAELPADHRGPAVFKYLGVPEDQRVSEARMNEVGAKTRHILESNAV